MAIIKKRIWPDYFELIQSGVKKFEMRVADFNVQAGDSLLLEEWDPQSQQYSGRSIEKKVGYVSKFTLDKFSQAEKMKEHGFYVIQFDE